MPDAGDVVVADFPGATGRKRRLPRSAVSAKIGNLTNRDLDGVRQRIKVALLAFQPPAVSAP